MQFVQTSNDGQIRILKLSRNKANALNQPMVEELMEALQVARSATSVRGLVFGSAQSRFFSAGFDVAEVFAYDAPVMRRFFGQFIDLYEAILRFPKPVIGALSGHAFAGGAFLTLAFDLRVMAEGQFGFALNEIDLGVVVPPCVRRMLINAVGPHHAARILLTGETINPHRALEIGLVDEVVPEAYVLPTSIRLAHKLADKPADVYSLTKRALQRDLGHFENPQDRTTLDEFIGQWFSPESVERRRALTATLNK